MRHVYEARLVPLGKPVRIPTDAGGTTRRATYTFDRDSFSIERTSKTKPEVWVDHDRALRIGQVLALYVSRDQWICADFHINDAPDDIDFEVGQPVSVGLDQLKVGSRGVFLREISIVSRGAVEGAQITARHALPPRPPAPSPTAARDQPGEIIYGGRIIRRTIGHVTAIGGQPVRTRAGDPIRHVDGDIIIDRADGSQVIYTGREGRAEAIRDGLLVR